MSDSAGDPGPVVVGLVVLGSFAHLLPFLMGEGFTAGGADVVACRRAEVVLPVHRWVFDQDEVEAVDPGERLAEPELRREGHVDVPLGQR